MSCVACAVTHHHPATALVYGFTIGALLTDKGRAIFVRSLCVHHRREWDDAQRLVPELEDLAKWEAPS